MKGYWNRRIVSLVILASALVSVGCFGAKVFTPETPAPSNPFVIEGRDAEFAATCADAYQAELGREPDADGAAACLDRCRRGETVEQLVAWLRASEEYKERQARLEREQKDAEERRRREDEERERRGRLRGRLVVDGAHFVDDAGETFRPVFTSALTLLVRSAEERTAFLDWAASVGFNGVRVFAGRLAWAGQTPAGAVAALPTVLEEAAARQMRVLVTAITDSRDGGYDEEAHLQAVAAATAPFPNVLLEVANETYHATQSDRVQNVAWLKAMAERALAGYPNPWALGAAATDEPVDGRYANAGGAFNTSHLDRGRDKWNQVRRVRELHAISEVTGRPTLNSEPMGAGEIAVPGRRENDPAFFFALGALNRLFEVGGVWHSEDALFARVPGPVQQACAKAFVEGSRIAPTDARLAYRNAGWANSPVAGAAFERTVVRVYAGVTDGPGSIVIAVGVSGDPEIRWANGYRILRTLADYGAVQVWEIGR